MRVALIGAGYWGKKLLRNLLQSSGYRVRTVIERKPGVLAVATELTLSPVANSVVADRW